MTTNSGARHADGLVQSMTGAGTAAGDCEVGRLSLECRSVNGRGLNVKVYLASECQGLESAIEDRVRQRIRRGSVRVAGIVSDPRQTSEPQLNTEFGERVAKRLEEFAERVGKAVSLSDILAFPGVVEGQSRSGPKLSRELPEGVIRLLDEALDALIEDRVREGEATTAVMLKEVESIGETLEEIRVLAPQVVEDHRERLLQRVNEFLDGRAKTMEPDDVIREVSVFADRVDISEEIQRLAVHGSKAHDVLRGGGAVGRKCEFLVQEMLREANTLGSKSPDVNVAHLVVRMKAGIDKLKEQAANLE
ncbi:MAG: YicC/YloC family endoribonuclease [Planctomycetota bacterium]|nr:YicC/YloC family endoribonuclease [Planctomycetota bacterium]